MASFTRIFLVADNANPPSIHSFTRGNNDFRSYKALYVAKRLHLQKKVGIIGSASRATQAIQGAASVAIPGDMSEIRSPVRSRVYSALTPGAPGLGGVPGVPGREERGYRCPEGFQYGGRFTDSRYSTCGRMLFDLVSLGRTIGQRAARAGRTATPTGDGAVNRLGRVGNITQPVVISRAIQIPRVGAEDKRKRDSVVSEAISTLTTSGDGSAVMVRRDGFALQPVVSTAELRKVPDNRNMEGATFLIAAGNAGRIGGDELGLLSNTGVTDLRYVTPSGVVLRLNQVRNLTTGERRKLGRTVNQATKLNNANDPSARLKAVAAETNGAIVYSEDLSAINNPDDLVRSGSTNIRRWVAESFKRSTAKPRSGEPEALTQVDSQGVKEKISSLRDAVQHLDDNGAFDAVAPAVLPNALAQAKSIKSDKFENVTRHTNADGKSWFEVTKPTTNEHLGHAVASELQKEIGLNAPKVQIMGPSGSRRPYLIEDPSAAAGKGNIKPGEAISPKASEDVLKLAASDWLLDERDRSPGNVVVIKNEAGDGAMASANPTSGLADLSKTEISQRQKLKLDDYLSVERQNFFAEAFDKRQAEQRRAMLRELDRIIERATAFNWDEFSSRLSVDGELSEAEKAHLNIIRKIFESRLDVLRGSKQVFLRLVGAA